MWSAQFYTTPATLLSAALRNWEEGKRAEVPPSRALPCGSDKFLQRRQQRRRRLARLACAARLSSAMIGALLFINAKGEIILDRKYRDDYNKASVETFRNQASTAKH